MEREEAIKCIRDFMGQLTEGCQEALKSAIPELAESEDERIRKFLVDFFASYKIGDAETKLNGVRIDDILAYLEKQKDILGERAKNITANMLEDRIGGIQRELIEFLSNTVNASWVDIIRSADAYAERIRNIIEKQKEQKPIKVIYIPKFRSGDTIVSTKNPHLTYIIRKTGIMDESGELCYECEILADGKSDNDIKLLSIEKVDSWGELIEQKEQKSVETWPNLSNCIHDCKNCLAKCLYRKEENPEQKPEWSEEDERMIGRIRSVVNECASYNDALDVNGDYCEGDYAKLDAWLKSLKPRTQ